MMKKFYLLTILLCFSTGLFAQEKKVNPENIFQGKLSVQQINTEESSPMQISLKSIQDAVFTEDFANGIDGNNELSQPWVVAGQNADLWRHDFDGPQDQWDFTTGPMESATADNGYMLFACAEYNDEIITGGGEWETTIGWIESPSMDLTDLNSVLVDFQTYYRYCCWNPSPITIGVSIDGGNIWSSFRAYNYNQYIEAFNNASGTLLVTADISSVAANQSNVKIRFSYNDPPSDLPEPNYGFYYLGIDDVSVYENPYANNLAVLQVMNGDVVELYEFKNYPLEQSENILVGAVYANYGSIIQTGVEITWDILSGDDIIHTSVESLGDIPTSREDANGTIVQNIDTAWFETGFTIEEVGTYTIRTSITGNEEEEFSENSILEKEIRVTPDVMSHDDVNLLNGALGPRDADDGAGFLFEEVGFGTLFFVVNPGSQAYGVQTVFAELTTPGTFASVEFYEVDSDDGINVPGFDNMPSDVPLAENEIEVTEEVMGQSVFIPFLEPVPLEVGKTYMAVIRQFEGDEELFVEGTNDTDTDNSSWLREIGGNGSYSWFSRPIEFAVRLGFSETVSINDISKLDIGLTVAPNPFDNFTNISYTLEESEKVSYKMFDVQGRLVLEDNFGSQSSGSHTIKIDGNYLESGIYYLNLLVGDSNLTEILVISK